MSDAENCSTDDGAIEISPSRGGYLPVTVETHPKPKSKKRTCSRTRKLWLLALAAFIVVVVVVVVVIVVVHRGGAPSVKGRFPRGAVAADVGKCSDTGRDILKQGGDAVDAAIAALLCVGVVNPQSSGLGGGHFMAIYRESTGKAEVISARERAPSAATANMAASKFGGKSIAVPGELRGMWEAHQRYGRLPWSDLFQPAIRLAKEGFPATDHLANALHVAEDEIKLQPGFVAKYTRPDGSWKRAGDMVYDPLMAETLRAIAENGVEEMYTGETAQRLIQDIRDNGGIMTEADLAGYSAEWVEPVRFSIGSGKTVVTTPSPSGGPIVQFILNILKNYNINSDDFKTTEDQVRSYHRFVESSKFAFALRSYLGDANTTEVIEALSKLQSEEFAREVSAQIRDDRVTHTDASGYEAVSNGAVKDGGTCHLSVADEDGDVVSVTSSVNYYFGSRIFSNRTGLVLNNEMMDFSSAGHQPGSSANYPGPGKMPLSAMSPVIVLNGDGEAELITGSAGSRAIITTNAWITVRATFTDASLTEIVDEKRIHNQLQPENVDSYEEGFQTDILDALKSMGHELKGKKIVSVVQAIRRMDNEWEAYSDPRKKGYSAGY